MRSLNFLDYSFTRSIPIWRACLFTSSVPLGTRLSTAAIKDSSETILVIFTKAPKAMMLANNALPKISLAEWVMGSS